MVGCGAKVISEFTNLRGFSSRSGGVKGYAAPAAARRFVSRHLYEDSLQACAQRVSARPEMMKLRRQTAEHPFATVKYQILGNARLLVRGIRAAAGELSLAVLAYNLKRAVNIKGVTWMQQALQV